MFNYLLGIITQQLNNLLMAKHSAEKQSYCYTFLLAFFFFFHSTSFLGVGILTRTRRPEPEPTHKYLTRNRTKNIQVFFGSKFFLPERTRTEKEPKKNRPDKNGFVPDLKTCISKTMMFLCSILYILFYDLVEISFVNNICYYF